jgi:hypothetical protein
MRENELSSYGKPIDQHFAWMNQRLQLVDADTGLSRERSQSVILMTEIERLRMDHELGTETMKRINEDRARVAEQLFGLAHTIVASQAAPGKAARFVQPCRRCSEGCCI